MYTKINGEIKPNVITVATVVSLGTATTTVTCGNYSSVTDTMLAQVTVKFLTQ